MNVMAKELSDLHPMQVVLLRSLGTFVFIFPFMVYHKVPIIGKQPKLLFLRGLVGFISLSCFFIVIQRIPLGSAISIRYLGPIFGALLAVYYLKEVVNKWQWLSFAISFSGVIILKGFDLRIDGLSFVLAIISAIFVGMVFVLVRYLGTREHYLTIINYFMMVSILGSICFIGKWVIPTGNEWMSVFGIGIFGMIGQIFMTKAFQLEEASVLAPFKYMELVYAIIFGYFFFAESYDLLPSLGILCLLYTSPSPRDS